MKSLATFWAAAFLGATLQAQTWTLSDAPTEGIEWNGLANSADGSKMALIDYLGGIYTSSTAGLTWHITGAPSGSWFSIASSTNGNTLVACRLNGSIYISTNSGATWDADGPGLQWYSVTCSADGSHFAAAAFGDGIYTNGGTGWGRTPAITTNWFCVASSGNGSRLAACVYGGLIYTSTNFGTAWKPANVASNLWHCITMSADGSNLVAGARFGGPIIYSTNAGTTWFTSDSQDDYWYSMKASTDGSRVLANDQGLAFISTNYGVNWSPANQPSPDSYYNGTISGDGSVMAVAAFVGPVYTTASFPTLAITNSGPNRTVSWPAFSPGFLLWQNTNLTTATWSAVTNNITTNAGLDHVTLPPAGGSVFYRLQAQ